MYYQKGTETRIDGIASYCMVMAKMKATNFIFNVAGMAS